MQRSLALSLSESLLGTGTGTRHLETIYRTDLHQDLVMLCDLFISLSSRLLMLRMFKNLRNLFKAVSNGQRRRSGKRSGTPLRYQRCYQDKGRSLIS